MARGQPDDGMLGYTGGNMLTSTIDSLGGKEQCLLLPPPQRLTRHPGRFALPGAPGMHFEHACLFASTVRHELGGKKAVDPATAVIRFRKSESAPRALLSAASRSEGYALVVTPGRITVWASTDAGHLMTLRQLVVQYGSVLSCLTI